MKPINIQHALNILGIKAGVVSFQACKMAYRKLSMKFHPDRDGGSNEMMSALNQAWQSVQAHDFDREPVQQSERNAEAALNLADDMAAAIQSIKTFVGVEIEVCGTWLWVGGNTKPYAKLFGENNFKWSPKKVKWYWRPEYQKSWRFTGNATMKHIRETYGSIEIETEMATGISGKKRRSR